MLLIKQSIAAMIGLGSGVAVAGGVFALITVIGIIPRLAGKTHTGKYVRTYETAIITGGVIGNLIDIFQYSIPAGPLSPILLGIFGLSCGTFVSCLVMSIAETLDVFPIMVRRSRLQVGLPYIILGFALGKVLGSYLYFYKGW